MGERTRRPYAGIVKCADLQEARDQWRYRVLMGFGNRSVCCFLLDEMACGTASQYTQSSTQRLPLRSYVVRREESGSHGTPHAAYSSIRLGCDAPRQLALISGNALRNHGTMLHGAFMPCELTETQRLGRVYCVEWSRVTKALRLEGSAASGYVFSCLSPVFTRVHLPKRRLEAHASRR